MHPTHVTTGVTTAAGPGIVAAPDTLRAVLFDMDGLLVDTEPLWFEVECAVMASLGGDWTAADQEALVGGSLHRSVDYLLDRAGRPPSVSHGQVADALVDGMAELLAERDIPALPGAIELVHQVRSAGLPCALVTSSERVIMDAVLGQLRRDGIEFDATVCGPDVRRPKPDPEPYLLAAERLGVDPAGCVALEDSPNGVAAAMAAGCVTIAVPGVAAIRPRPGLLIVDSLTAVDLDRLRGLASSG